MQRKAQWGRMAMKRAEATIGEAGAKHYASLTPQASLHKQHMFESASVLT